MSDLAVTIPTRNRPDKLRRCLEALALAREHAEFRVHVCDSSTDRATREAVRRICAESGFARHHAHTGRNVAAARNVCALVADAPLIVNVDDDVYVEPEAIARLAETHRRHHGPCVVAGSVCWDGEWSVPLVRRLIGWGRPARPGERPSFLIGAFFAYPRAFALAWPWNDRIGVADDKFMSALWRGKGVELAFDPRARAVHDCERVVYRARHQGDHIYANLFDALLAEPHLGRALAYELLGFASGLKAFARDPATAREFLRAWVAGHRALARDWRELERLLERQAPGG